MFERYWNGAFAFIALGFVLLAIAFWAVWGESAKLTEQRLRSEQSAQSHIIYAEDRIDEKCLGLEPIPLRDCIHEEIESAHDHSRANQDLNAQREMANFTRIMGWTAIVGLVLGAGSVFLIFLTLRSSQEMAVATREIGQAQVRAYLSVDKILLDWEDGRNLRCVDIRIENTGASPASYVSLSSRIAVVSPKGFHLEIGDEGFREAFGVLEEDDFGQNIPANGSSKLLAIKPVTKENLGKWHAGDVDIFLLIQGNYKDVFNGDQFFEYCCRFVLDETDTHFLTHFEIYSPFCNST